MAPRLAPQRAVSGTGAVTGDRADGGGGGGGGALVERVGAVCDAFGRSMEAHNLRCRDLKCCTRTALGRGDDVQTLAISTVIVAGASGVELKRVALKVGKLCSGKFGLLRWVRRGRRSACNGAVVKARQPPPLFRLQQDVLFCVLEWLGGRGLCALACTAKTMRAAAHDDALWLPLANALPATWS